MGAEKKETVEEEKDVKRGKHGAKRALMESLDTPCDPKRDCAENRGWNLRVTYLL